MKGMMKNNGEAVSPVVGVMLMLVVTIIIAAVVSGFAGGMTGDVQKTPNVMLDVQISTAVSDNMGGTMQAITFEALSGDKVPTKDLRIITYKTNKTTGDIIKMTNDANSESAEYGSTVLPFLNDRAKTGGSSKPAAHFGNYTLSTGDIMVVQYEGAVTQFLGDPINEGDAVDVKILYVPSDTYIFDKEVIVI